MAYQLNKLQFHDFNFTKEFEILFAYIKKHWNISAIPKGFKEFLKKEYHDDMGISEKDEQALLKNFDGHDGSGTLSYPFPIRIYPVAVANEKVSPLETLLGAVLAYGMLLGMRLAEVDPNSDTHYRMTWLGHAYSSMADETDPQLQVIYLKEAHEYTSNFKKEHHDILKEYEEKRANYILKVLKRELDTYFKEESGRVRFTRKAQNNKISEIYSYLYRLGFILNPFEKYMKKRIGEIGYNILQKKEDYILYPKSSNKNS